MGIKSILSKILILGILVFAIMSYIIIVQNNNDLDASSRITNNTLINESYGDLETSLNKQGSSEDALDALEDVPPEEYVGDLNVASTVSATRTARSIITGVWNVLIKLPMIILGVDPVVLSAIGTILLIFMAIGIWAIWKGAIS